MSLKEKNKITAVLTGARWVLPVFIWVIITLFSYQFILTVEERSLFIFDPLWLKDFLNKPSGLLSCCSVFLTQFLHIPWLGTLIWVVLLTVSAELTRIVYKMPSHLSILTYIPAAIFVSYNMSLGYSVYLLTLPGYFFMPVLGYLWALLTVSVLRKTNKASVALGLFLIWGFAGYYIAGVYSLAGITAASADIILSDRKRLFRTLTLAGTAAVLILAPIAFAGTTTYNLSDGWIIGMPEKNYGLPPVRMQLPLVIAMLFLVMAPLSKFLNGISGKKALTTICLSFACVIAIPSVFWFRDDNFKAELGMINAVYDLDWDRTVDIYEKIQAKHSEDPSWEPTRVLVLLKNLALIKTGQEGNRAFDFDNGCRMQKTESMVPMSFQIGKILFLHYGIPGISNRWCGEESVLFGRNYMTYKYYTMIAILFNDTTLIKEYLNILDHTMFYRKWSKEQAKLYKDRKLLAKTAPYDQIIPLICYEDRITSDLQGCELYLANHFNGPRPENATPLYDRVSLFFAMESKQSELFWLKFFLYLDSNNPSKIDRYYQEAAFLLSNISHNKALENLPFDDRTKELYNSFIQNASMIGKKSLEESRAALPAYLRHTYYYYYYYVNELQLF